MLSCSAMIRLCWHLRDSTIFTRYSHLLRKTCIWSPQPEQAFTQISGRMIDMTWVMLVRVVQWAVQCLQYLVRMCSSCTSCRMAQIHSAEGGSLIQHTRAVQLQDRKRERERLIIYRRHTGIRCQINISSLVLFKPHCGAVSEKKQKKVCPSKHTNAWNKLAGRWVQGEDSSDCSVLSSA